MAQHLISIGADLSLRCKWTDMSALHYAAYFDVGPVLTTLLRKTKVMREFQDLDYLTADLEIIALTKN